MLTTAVDLGADGRHEEAIELFDQLADAVAAIRATHREPTAGLQDLEWAIESLRTAELAAAMVDAGSHGAGIELFERTLATARERGDLAAESKILEPLSGACWEAGLFAEAERHLQRAIEVEGMTGDVVRQAMFLNNLGVLYRQMGRTQAALGLYRKSLLMRRQTGDRVGESDVLANLGVAYSTLGLPGEARAFLEEAVATQLELESGDVGLSLLDLGGVYDNLGDEDAAKDCYEAGIEVYKAALATAQVRDEAGREVVLHNLAVLCMRVGWTAEAITFCEQAIAETGQATRFEMKSRRLMGDLLSASNRAEEAIGQYEFGVSLARRLGDVGEELTARTRVGVVLRDSGSPHRALYHFEPAMELVDRARTELLSSELRASFGATTRTLFEAYIGLKIEMNDVGAAFDAAERGRARAFLDLLAESEGGITEGVAEELRAEERRLLGELCAMRESLIGARSRSGSSSDDVEAEAWRSELERRERELELAYQVNQSEIRLRSPRYSQLAHPDIWDTERIQRDLLGEGTALLEYVLGDEVSWLFVLLSDGGQVYRLPPKRDIEPMVAELRNAVVSRANNYPHGRELYDVLVRPAEPRLVGKALLVVPDGALHFLPFALLLTGDPETAVAEQPVKPSREERGVTYRSVLGPESTRASGGSGVDYRALPYLVRQHAISYAPSASVAGMLSSSERQPSHATVTYAAIGHPKTERLESTIAAAESLTAPVEKAIASAAFRSVRRTLPPLPDTEAEVWGIAREVSADLPVVKPWPERYDGPDVTIRTGSLATKAELRSMTAEGKTFRFIHIATHGLVDSEKAQFSGLVFTPDDQGDAFWRTFEIFNAHIPCEMVVLSACETGLGRLVTGEGLTGLTRAFMYAGARAVCASLWIVSDESTPRLMVDFYRRIVAGASKPIALQQSQLDMISAPDGRDAHPFFWAPFALLGDALASARPGVIG
jgi:CHAT domain-containing protein/tetratricopeptide (TPR) repeat protein